MRERIINIPRYLVYSWDNCTSTGIAWNNNGLSSWRMMAVTTRSAPTTSKESSATAHRHSTLSEYYAVTASTPPVSRPSSHLSLYRSYLLTYFLIYLLVLFDVYTTLSAVGVLKVLDHASEARCPLNYDNAMVSDSSNGRRRHLFGDHGTMWH